VSPTCTSFAGFAALPSTSTLPPSIASRARRRVLKKRATQSQMSSRTDGRGSITARTRRSQADAAAQDVPVHDPVADEAVERLPERRRLVLLEHEVADPRESVARERREREPPRIAGAQRGD